MKFLICLLGLIIFPTVACNGQSVNTEQTTTSMRKFDLEAFEKHKTGNSTYCRYTTTNYNGDTIEVALAEHKELYQENISFKNTPMKNIYTYSKRTLNMISEIEIFYNCAIGVKKEYDEKGELIKITDNDKPYKFSWQDLVKKMKEEYDIELIDIIEQIKKRNYVSSVKRSPQTMLYYINMPREMIQSNAARLERFEINANTGEVINHFGNPKRKINSLGYLNAQNGISENEILKYRDSLYNQIRADLPSLFEGNDSLATIIPIPACEMDIDKKGKIVIKIDKTYAEALVKYMDGRTKVLSKHQNEPFQIAQSKEGKIYSGKGTAWFFDNIISKYTNNPFWIYAFHPGFLVSFGFYKDNALHFVDLYDKQIPVYTDIEPVFFNRFKSVKEFKRLRKNK